MLSDAEQLYARLWREKYRPLAAAAREDDACRRSEDFIDAPRPVGIWLLRPLTLMDMLVCEGYECPLIHGAEVALQLTTPDALWWFAWLLRADADAGPLARWFFIRRMRRRHFAPDGTLTPAYFADLAAVVEFVTRHFADSGFTKIIDPATGRPRPARDTGTHWIAGIVVAFGCEMAWREGDVLRLHLGRLWQYMRRLELRANPKTLVPDATKKLEGDCLAEVQEILRAEAALAVPAPVPPAA